MTKAEDYRQRLAELDEWEPFLLAESGLPGPRGDIELGHAVADAAGASPWRPHRTPVGR
jgi:hypothetical protein